MIVDDIEINYMLDYGNSPRIRITVDKIPDFDPLKPIWNYDKSTGMVWAEQDDLIRFIVFTPSSYSNPQWNGFAGEQMTYVLKDYTILQSNNWWSGGAYGLVASGIECIDVKMSDQQGDLPFTMAMRIEKTKELMPNETFIKEKLGKFYSWAIKKPTR